MSRGPEDRAGLLRTEFHLRDNLDHFTAEIEAIGAAAIEAGAIAAAAAAQANSTIDLQLEVIPTHPVPGGMAAGIDSKKRGSVSDVRLAPIFDGGALGKRRRKLATNRARREEWDVTRGDSTYTAHRHELTPDMGIPPQNFFAKGRRAGLAAIVEKLHRGL